MKNKRRLKAILLAALAAVGTLLLSSCDSNSKTLYTGRTKVFDTGKHLLSVPIRDDYKPNTDKVNIECPDGYQVAGMGVTSGSGILVVLFENIVPVECAETEKGYNEIGIPVEKENTLKLN